MEDGLIQNDTRPVCFGQMKTIPHMQKSLYLKYGTGLVVQAVFKIFWSRVKNDRQVMRPRRVNGGLTGADFLANTGS